MPGDSTTDLSEGGLGAGLGGGVRTRAGAGGFSRGRFSLLCSWRTSTRKRSARRGKAAGEKRLQLGAKK